MIAIFKCGKCGKNTQMYPKGTPVFEERMEEFPVEIKETDADGKLNIRVENHTRKFLVQKTRKIRQQNIFNGEIEHVDVGLEDYHDVRKTVQLQLRIGDEHLTRGVCSSCYKKIEPIVEQLWDILAKLKSF